MRSLPTFLLVPVLALGAFACTEPEPADPFDGQLVLGLNRIAVAADAEWLHALARLGPNLGDVLAQLGPPAPGRLLPSSAVGTRFLWDPIAGEYAPSGESPAGDLSVALYRTVPGTTLPALPLDTLGFAVMTDRSLRAEFTYVDGEAGGDWEAEKAGAGWEATGVLRRSGTRVEVAYARLAGPDSAFRDADVVERRSGVRVLLRVAGVPGVEAIRVEMSIRGWGDLRLSGLYDVHGPDLLVEVNSTAFARITLTPQLALVLERLDGASLSAAEEAVLVAAEELVGRLEETGAALLSILPATP